MQPLAQELKKDGKFKLAGVIKCRLKSQHTDRPAMTLQLSPACGTAKVEEAC